MTVSFKIDEKDVGKPANEVIRINENSMVSFLSTNSFYNGLILSDKIVKVNGASGNISKYQTELMKGETCSVEVTRRKNIIPATRERLKKSGCVLRRDNTCFVIEVEKTSAMKSATVGVTVTYIQKRGIVTRIEPSSLASIFFGRGDLIMDINEESILNAEKNDDFIREKLSGILKGEKVTFLVERPVSVESANTLRHLIESVAPDPDVKMANDAICIGRNASNMHYNVLKKLQPKSILSRDVFKGKNPREKKPGKKLSKEKDNTIKISTATSTANISTDVAEDEIDNLKNVVTKSHAVRSGDEEEERGAFDDE